MKSTVRGISKTLSIVFTRHRLDHFFKIPREISNSRRGTLDQSHALLVVVGLRGS